MMGDIPLESATAEVQQITGLAFSGRLFHHPAFSGEMIGGLNRPIFTTIFAGC